MTNNKWRGILHIPVASVTGWPLVGVGEVIAAHYPRESVILGQGVGNGLFVIARAFVRDDISCRVFIQ
jgi:hypothetical protein